MKIYTQKIQSLTQTLASLQKKSNTIGGLRFVAVFIFCLGLYFYPQNFAGVLLTLAAIAFVYGIWVHKKIRKQLKFNKILLQINQEELDYVQNQNINPFKNGAEFLDKHHLYAQDLDVFGAHSLYQHLNRTATVFGAEKLADLLKNRLSSEKILQNQDAVQELKEKIDCRQNVYAWAKWVVNTQETQQKLLDWIKKPLPPFSTMLYYLMYVLPVALFGSILLFAFLKESIYLQIASSLFLANLFVFIFQYRSLQKALVNADAITEILQQYSIIFSTLEKENWHAERLKNLQNTIQASSAAIAKLSKLFADLASMQNIVGALLINGLCLFHIHILKALVDWHQKYAKNIQLWLEVMGEIEALSSLSNFAYNHPDFIFPQLNANFEISFQNMGHPLIISQKRVNNSVHFAGGQMIILTGSNMSGKSTFLRALGVNLVLAGIGAPVCASLANIHPLPLCTLMRVSDDLSENRSYFMAEVLRLKAIMQALDQSPCFVLLDEILRGTNSEDKQKGTIAVIEKLLEKKAMGMIATHDTSVCNLEKDYEQLSNKYFASRIVGDELVFDYQLREGFCQSKSAQFLLEREGVV